MTTDVAIAPREPSTELGPAMRALPPRWQKAVVALFAHRGNMSAAYRAAGFNPSPTHEASVRTSAWRLFHDPRVRAAVREVAVSSIDISEPETLGTVLEIMRNNNEKAQDRLAAARILLDRSNPVLHKTKIEVEHIVSMDELDVTHYRALQQIGAPRKAYLDRFGANNLSRVEQLVAQADAKAKAIDTSYEEVPNE